MSYSIKLLQAIADECPLQRTKRFAEYDHTLLVMPALEPGKVVISETWSEWTAMGREPADCVLFFGDRELAFRYLVGLLGGQS